ncbi:sulfatase-like hydrolase/transferase [Geminicoccus harenae]|uniref:sulfatase-like hydrolase/transferase n=1 Tax=Geminicoccus harenae TaxID=2498453 RepID=UPI00168AEBB4|nr:sulfatase-like hydrolase/transferase [Geminicoccus harenae]
MLGSRTRTVQRDNEADAARSATGFFARRGWMGEASIGLGLLLLRLVAILAFVALTNFGIAQRLHLLADQQRWGTLAVFVTLWGVCLAALLIGAFQPNAGLRIGWAVIFAGSTGLGVVFRWASGSDLTVLDIISMWHVRHEAVRAADFYQHHIELFSMIFAGALVILAAAPSGLTTRASRWLGRLWWAPALPVVLIAAILFQKEGGGASGLPRQFTPLAVGAVSGMVLANNPVPQRSEVEWTPGLPRVRSIVLLVDESVRGDYIDWTPGNPYTPGLASRAASISNFGPAASGGNCSHYSNAILRFMGSRNRLGKALLTNPTIWQYAKKAGFRTVYIDAQASIISSSGKMQNFMTTSELRSIDSFQLVGDAVAPAELDNRMLDMIKAELATDEPVFIYAVKNGAHFPYDMGYPPEEVLFRPTMTEAPKDDASARIRSYRNVVRWSVDRFFARVFDELELDNTVILYTSDHGQQFRTDRLPHCTVEQPDPREALVPLFTITGHAQLKTQFDQSALSGRGHASHFAIMPAILELIGYDTREVSVIYPESLLKTNLVPLQFTSGDILGLFSNRIRWHPLDLDQDYLEQLEPDRINVRPAAAHAAW